MERSRFPGAAWRMRLADRFGEALVSSAFTASSALARLIPPLRRFEAQVALLFIVVGMLAVFMSPVLVAAVVSGGNTRVANVTELGELFVLVLFALTTPRASDDSGSRKLRAAERKRRRRGRRSRSGFAGWLYVHPYLGRCISALAFVLAMTLFRLLHDRQPLDPPWVALQFGIFLLLVSVPLVIRSSR